MQPIPQEFRAAYQEYDREFTIRKTRLGCFFGIVMVPLFGGLDHFVYPQQAVSFFILRLVCSALMAGFYPVLGTGFGRKYYHFQGLVLLFFPTATIAWMIYTTEGTASPYYGGLTLVLMVVAMVLDWSFWQSVAAVVLVLLLYVAACLFSPAPFETRLFIGSLFFLVSSGACGCGNLSPAANWTRAARRSKPASSSSRKTRCNWCSPKSSPRWAA